MPGAIPQAREMGNRALQARFGRESATGMFSFRRELAQTAKSAPEMGGAGSQLKVAESMGFARFPAADRGLGGG